MTDLRERVARAMMAQSDFCRDAIGEGNFRQLADAAIAEVNKDTAALVEALRNIQIEAERENGSWVHLKRVIALNCRAAIID